MHRIDPVSTPARVMDILSKTRSALASNDIAAAGAWVDACAAVASLDTGVPVARLRLELGHARGDADLATLRWAAAEEIRGEVRERTALPPPGGFVKTIGTWGLAPHSEAEFTHVVKDTKLPSDMAAGPLRLQLEYCVGSGGGHQLHVCDIVLHSEADGTATTIAEIHNHISGPDPDPWYSHAEATVSDLKGVRLTGKWRDQGWGNRKGRLRLNVLAGDPADASEEMAEFLMKEGISAAELLAAQPAGLACCRCRGASPAHANDRSIRGHSRCRAALATLRRSVSICCVGWRWLASSTSTR
eukprot:NODE_827_length_1350_cov_206.330502.p1 GENE.NODE_827_length_1350_cov_206.330502~~NODE_827_length_1350_cov_206.330502.p1  ORF type:complete len:301 (+),score=51.38 NODE_827_length_1350_cov_206.330502:244-1146(+)